MGDGSSGARRTAKAAQIIRTVDPGAAARAWAKQTQPSGPPNVSLEAFAALQGCPRLRATGHSADPHGRRAAVHSRAVVQASSLKTAPHSVSSPHAVASRDVSGVTFLRHRSCSPPSAVLWQWVGGRAYGVHDTFTLNPAAAADIPLGVSIPVLHRILPHPPRPPPSFSLTWTRTSFA
jgi:hypothetical protein